jgi:tRNA(adenine34) deaminase
MAKESEVNKKQDELFMLMAVEEARRAAEKGEVPVGAVIVDMQQNVLARAGNSSIADHDPAGHAEIKAMRQAGATLNNYRLLGTTLYVTIEPCIMCAGAIVHARISRLVFGASDPKAGAIVSCYNIGSDRKLNHEFEIKGGVMDDVCSGLLRDFFRSRRK